MELMKPQLGRQLRCGHPMSRGLVGCWLFNENPGPLGWVNDYSGNGNHGTLVGDTHSVPGKFGNALTFGGVSAYVDIPNASQGPTTAMAVVWWGKSTNTSIDTTIFWNGTTTITNGLWVGLDNSFSGNHRFYCYLEDVGNNIYEATGNTNDDVWRQFAVTYDGVAVKYYENGIYLSENAASGTIGYDGTTSRLGNDGNDDYEHKGEIDHVLLYNRALTAGEVASLYLDPFQMFEGDL